jgi:hypothetical protein
MVEAIQFQLDFSTVDVERGTRIGPLASSIMLEPNATSTFIVFELLPQPGIIAIHKKEEVILPDDRLGKGYMSMGLQNSLLAEEYLPIALESWPTWED